MKNPTSISWFPSSQVSSVRLKYTKLSIEYFIHLFYLINWHHLPCNVIRILGASNVGEYRRRIQNREEFS